MALEIHLRKTVGGFVPDSDRDTEAARALKFGQVVKAKVVRERSYLFFKKWWALVETGFGLWCELAKMPTYKGESVAPDLERFRKDITILAGFGRPVVNIRGEVRMEAESIAFGNMTEERFEALYSATINALISKVLGGYGVTEERLRSMVEAVMEFS
jgi:hypothetical protein